MENSKIKVGSVNYLNARPLLFGLEQGYLKNDIELVFDHPAAIAQQLIAGKIDIGLVPVAIIPEIPGAEIISNYGIGCDGTVGTVCIFSEMPLKQITHVFLDYQSRTSVELVKILFREHWKMNPKFVEAFPGYEDEIKSSMAGLVIGDRAFSQKKKSAYCYDLGMAWKEMTGLPFLFAAWVSNKKLSNEFIQKFNDLNLMLENNIEQIIEKINKPELDLDFYFKKQILYKIDENMKKGYQLFCRKVGVL